MTKISLTPNAKLALAFMGAMDGGVQVNVSQKGCTVATRTTPGVSVLDEDLSQAILLCAREFLAEAEMMAAGEPFYAKRLAPLIHGLQCLPGIGDVA